MLEILKWDFINFIKKYYWIYVGIAICFALAGFLPNSAGLISTFADGICLIYSLLFFIWTIIFSLILTVSWLSKESALLELSLPAKPWETLLSKITLSYVVNFSGLLLSLQLWKLIDHFGISSVVVFNSSADLIQYLLGISVVIVLFFSLIFL